MAAGNFVDNEFERECESGDEIREEEHGKLLRAMHIMDSMQRIKPPTRTEPSLIISEFHVGPVKDGHVHFKDLAKSLESRGKAFGADVAQGLRNFTQTSRRISTPLEKTEEQKIKRVVAYNNLKKSVDRWDAIVQTNRYARTLTFPLDIEPVAIDTSDLAARWQSQSQTPLEAGLNELHGRSKVFQKDKKAQIEFKLTYAELKEKRKEMAKLRAQRSYEESKARRVKKIKSKKFHRIRRREKMQKQFQDFEALQKTDPEAALKELEKLEKERAKERMTLRHKNTGHWARSRLIRAKYDPQTRQELAEQLTVSRELTKKTKAADSSDDDEAETRQNEASKKFADDKNNPWVTVKPSSEIDEFISGYRKYWEEQHQKANGISKDTEEQKTSINEEQSTLAVVSEVVSVSTNNEKQECPNSENMNTIESSLNCETSESQNFSIIMHSENEVGKDQSCFNEHENMIQDIERNVILIDKGNGNIENENSGERDTFVDTRRKMTETSDEMEMVAVSKLKAERNKKLRCKKNHLKAKNKARSTSCWVVTPVSEVNKNTNVTNEMQEDMNVTTEKPENVRTVASDNRVDLFLASVLPNALEREGKTKKKKKTAFDKMFDDVEKDVSVKVQDKLYKLKSELVVKDNFLETNKIKSQNKENDLGASLALKDLRGVVGKQAREDTQLSEGPGKHSNEAKPIAERAIKASDIIGITGSAAGQIESSSKLPETNINPDKFIVAKPKVLLTAAPELITAGEEALDDDMENDQQMIISEAFADDDVVDDFRKEKEAEIEKSKIKDIDLSMPGWGDWGGIGTKPPKRKNRRLIFKAPPQPPRCDAEKLNLIINETKATGIREHQVCELPLSFRSVKDFEASIRAPIGATWIPQTAHQKMIEPAVITYMGTVIKPMNEEFLVNKKTLLEFEN